jgi:PAS domain S-box-containing protein
MNKIGSIDDMIIIKGLKEDLRASEKSFKQLFNCSHVPQWIYDRDSLLILYVNDAAIRQYGYSSKEFLNMTILEIAPHEETQKLILYNEFMKTTIEPFSIVSPHRKKNSEKVLAETTSVNIKYKEKACVLVTSSNITEKIKLEEKISSLKVTRQQKITQATINGQEMEREEIGRELHDNINQQLAATKLYLEAARANATLRIDFIDRAEKMLLKVMNEIRSLSNSLALPILKDIGFKDSLNELFETYMVTKLFRINLSFEEKLNDLEHEIQLSLFRIIQEQLNNILKHAHAQNVMINMSVSDQISLSIKDDGKGFDTTMKRQGMGITNIKNRVALYNGTVSINSKPEQGCEVLINIPHGMKNEIKSYANILIVEDDSDDQEIIARAFAEVAPHFKITCLDSGKMLVDLLQSSPDNELPSLIVLDYNMPIQNGLEILKVLELDQRFNKIPKIIYSNSSQKYFRNLSYSENAKAYITKGTTMDEIKENIQEMLSFV